MGRLKTAIIPIFIGLFVVFSHLAGLSEGAETKTAEEAMVVENGKTVKVGYKLTVDGDVVDSSEAGKPLQFEVGQSQVIPGFEKELMGMKVGDAKSFTVSPEDGYGNSDPQAIYEIPKDKLGPDITPEPGMNLYVKGNDGQAIPVRIDEVKEETIVINFNHPLAGKSLNFDVEIMSID